MEYACFGDVVSFDTTFQTTKFEMPFAPFLGTNHHKQTIIFGVALLFNETMPSFVWLFVDGVFWYTKHVHYTLVWICLWN
jgi:zinc finger SWIM domain-containing protein 3